MFGLFDDLNFNHFIPVKRNEREETNLAIDEYDCKIVKQEFGHYCGYVKIEEDSPLFGKEYNDETFYGEGKINVHGGLTFSEPMNEDKTDWWIGFDCAHYCDLCNPKPHEFVVEELTEMVKQVQFLEQLLK